MYVRAALFWIYVCRLWEIFERNRQVGPQVSQLSGRVFYFLNDLLEKVHNRHWRPFIAPQSELDLAPWWGSVSNRSGN